jgi:tetratricopeptide (TPR) repeat protein
MNDTLSLQELSEEGKAAYQRGDFLGSARAYEAAAQGYEATGDALTAAEMLNNSSVAYLRAGDEESALRVVQDTPDVFASEQDIRRQGIAFGNLGAALDALKRLDEAADAYQRSAELLGQAGEADLRAHVLKSLSLLQLRKGEQMEAVATMQASLGAGEKNASKGNFFSRLLKRSSQKTDK